MDLHGFDMDLLGSIGIDRDIYLKVVEKSVSKNFENSPFLDVLGAVCGQKRSYVPYLSPGKRSAHGERS